jgi:hypothetical protein
MSDTAASTAGWNLDLYWIPLGVGTSLVRLSGRTYETAAAMRGRRTRRRLFHSALVAGTPDGRVTIEMAAVPNDTTPAERGVVADGAVGTRFLGRYRVFRYEIRRWLGGVIPDLSSAVASPVSISTDPGVVAEVLRLIADVPSPVWGRDELGTGEMWNSNSVTAWVLARAGVDGAAGAPPSGGRAPGWFAGLAVAKVMAPEHARASNRRRPLNSSALGPGRPRSPGYEPDGQVRVADRPSLLC